MRWISFGIILLLFSCNELQEDNQNYTAVKLSLAQDTIVAGAPIHIECREADQADIILSSVMGPAVFSLEGGKATIPAKYMRRIGPYKLQAVSNNKIVGEAEFHVVAGAPYGKISINNGPKTLMAGEEELNQCIAVPMDSLGNVQHDGMVVTYTMNKEGEKVKETVPINNLHSVLITKGGKNVAQIKLGASCGAAYSNIQNIEVIPGPPVNLKIRTIGKFRDAYDRYVIHLASDLLVDQHNNPVADGLLLDIVLHHENRLYAKYTAETIHETFEQLIPLPNKEGVFEVFAEVPGVVQSNKINFTTHRNVYSVKVKFDKHLNKVIVGPVKNDLHAIVENGMQLALKTPTEILSSQVNDGFASFNISDLDLTADSLNLVVILDNFEQAIKIPIH